MIRVYAIVKGQTEETFVKQVLSSHLGNHQVCLKPIILGKPGHKGGRTGYQRVKRDVLKQLKQDKCAYCTTMLDFYGLGPDFPGMSLSSGISSLKKVNKLEQAFKQDIVNAISGNLRPDLRFHPYLQLHEFEALLFSEPVAFARGIKQPNLARDFQQIRTQFKTPEDIDVQIAPSKRILGLYPNYQKPVDGSLAAIEVTLTKMRKECPHFNDWLQWLEQLASLCDRQ